MGICEDLKVADLKGLAPPQDWTTRAVIEIDRLMRQNKELLEALQGLYRHTKNDLQICGLNESAEAAIARAGEK